MHGADTRASSGGRLLPGGLRAARPACDTAGVSSTPTPPSGQAPEPTSPGTGQRPPEPRRNLVGAGFALLGGYFAYNLWGIPMSLWLKVPLLALFAAVAVYGLAQLWQNRRR